jgi:hypothetical protein
LAVYWQSYADTGNAPAKTQLLPGPWTDEATANVDIQRNGTQWSFNGLYADQLFHAGGPQELWRFGTQGGGVTCGVERLERYWYYPGEKLYQPAERDNWGPTIAPGYYKAIVGSDIGQPCFLSGPAGVTVIAGHMSSDTEEGLGHQPLPPPPPTTTTTTVPQPPGETTTSTTPSD